MRGATIRFPQDLLAWYDRCRRDLPWRLGDQAPPGARLDPYHVLLSEAMLQQTQVATVVPYFRRFLERLPTLADLAAADEQAVLRLWQGLGYYSRARNLHAAAKAVMRDYQGQIPATVEQLRKLPGVGRYTAGAVASIAFDQRVPIVDGNVARVVCRLDRIETDPRQKPTLELLWKRAEQLLPGNRIGDFNSALMELGATVCTPRSPACESCPVARYCQAYVDGVQERLPLKVSRKATPRERRWTICVCHDDAWLIEQRPAKGRWAGLWQFTTLPAGTGKPDGETVQAEWGLQTEKLVHLGVIEHALTHRRYRFDVYRCQVRRRGKASGSVVRKWVKLAELDRYPLPRPHLRIAQLLLTELHQG